MGNFSNSFNDIEKALTVKNYAPVSGGQYAHPKVWARHLAENFSSIVVRSLIGSNHPEPGQVNVALTGASLKDMGMPYYYVGADYLREVINTRLAGDIQFGELRWPCKAITFGLPMDVVREYVGFNVDIPFIAGATFNQSIIVDLAETFKGLETYFSGLPRIKIDRPRMTTVFADMKDRLYSDIILASYGSSYSLNMTVGSIQTLEHMTWSETEWSREIKLNLSREDESEVNRKMCLLFVKLLVHLACDEPRYKEPERPTKPIHKNAKNPRNVFWHVPFIGRAYRLPQDPTGTHASPKRHLRRRHVVRQAIGPRDKIFPVSKLPRTQDGVTDWEQVTDEMRQAFWSSHKEVIVSELLVKDPSDEAPPVV
jgi:hypothetical protein